MGAMFQESFTSIPCQSPCLEGLCRVTTQETSPQAKRHAGSSTGTPPPLPPPPPPPPPNRELEPNNATTRQAWLKHLETKAFAAIQEVADALERDRTETAQEMKEKEKAEEAVEAHKREKLKKTEGGAKTEEAEKENAEEAQGGEKGRAEEAQEERCKQKRKAENAAEKSDNTKEQRKPARSAGKEEKASVIPEERQLSDETPRRAQPRDTKPHKTLTELTEARRAAEDASKELTKHTSKRAAELQAAPKATDRGPAASRNRHSSLPASRSQVESEFLQLGPRAILADVLAIAMTVAMEKEENKKKDSKEALPHARTNAPQGNPTPHDDLPSSRAPLLPVRKRTPAVSKAAEKEQGKVPAVAAEGKGASSESGRLMPVRKGAPAVSKAAEKAKGEVPAVAAERKGASSESGGKKGTCRVRPAVSETRHQCQRPRQEVVKASL